MKCHFLIKIIYFILISGLIIQCTPPAPEPGTPEHIKLVTGKIDDLALTNADLGSGDWLTYGGNYQEDRYSTLEQINKVNIGELGLASTIELGTKRGIQSTPIVVDGIMFFTASWSVAYAVDIRKGEIIWKYDPEVPRETASQLCCGVVNRGMAIYKGSVIFGTLDGRLISLDASNGTVNWEKVTVDGIRKYSITGAPRIANGNVLIGNGGAEFDARGYVTAYNAETGEQAWRFYTVPGDPSKPFEHPDLEDAAKTWTGEWWKQGGGGTAWDAIVYDPELNQVYIGVGNGSHWNRDIRSPDGGDNLYLSSIVALNADDGSYKWHFQTTPGDTWDYTATQHIVLADLNIEGKDRKVLMQAPKNGFFYVIDRTNGKFISGDSYSYMNWATGLDANGRPIEAANARYQDGRTYWITPSSQGSHNWHPMSFNHATGHMYIPTGVEAGPYFHMANIGYGSKEALGGSVGVNISIANKLYNPPVFDTNEGAPAPGVAYGRLISYDPIRQKVNWAVNQKVNYNGGLLSTSTGLLFQGDAEGKFSARDVNDGKVIWEFDVRSGAIASPITYLVDGEQYISILVGWGGYVGQSAKAVARVHPGTLYTFKIGGNAEAPKKLPALETNLTALTTDAAPQVIGNGFDLYTQFCIACHNGAGQGGGAIPDLTRSSDAVFANYNEIVLNGQLASQGMPKFGEFLNEKDVEEIKSFVLYTSQSFRAGMDATTYITNIATYQYMADQAQALKAANGIE